MLKSYSNLLWDSFEIVLLGSVVSSASCLVRLMSKQETSHELLVFPGTKGGVSFFSFSLYMSIFLNHAWFNRSYTSSLEPRRVDGSLSKHLEMKSLQLDDILMSGWLVQGKIGSLFTMSLYMLVRFWE